MKCVAIGLVNDTRGIAGRSTRRLHPFWHDHWIPQVIISLKSGNAQFNGVIIGLGNVFFNSLAPGKFEWNFTYVIFKRILVIDGWGFSCEIARIWISLDFTDDQSY